MIQIVVCNYSCRTQVLDDKSLRILKEEIDYESDCENSTYDTGQLWLLLYINLNIVLL